MADKELSASLSGGAITNYKKGGITTNEDLLSRAEIQVVLENDTSSKSRLSLTPILEAVPHTEGTIYYSDSLKDWMFQTEFPNLELGLGDSPIRIVNNSGATIVKGKPVRHNGVSLTGVPQIELALADDFVNAIVLGLTAHDIPNGTEGYLIEAGRLVGINTSLLATGVPVYLSDTIAGGLTTIAPEIVTKLGGVLLSGTLDGQFQLAIANTIELPTIGAFFQSLPDTTPIDSTTRTFGDPLFFPQGFTLEETLLIDISSGYTFGVPIDGIYGGSFAISLSNIHQDANGHVIAIGINVNGIQQFVFNGIVGRNDNVMSASFVANIKLSAGDFVSLTYTELTNNGIDNDGNIVIDGIQMAIESKQIR